MTERLKTFLTTFDPWKAIGGLIIAGIVAVYGANTWVQASAQRAVLDEHFLATLAARVRPACIFDTPYRDSLMGVCFDLLGAPICAFLILKSQDRLFPRESLSNPGSSLPAQVSSFDPGHQQPSHEGG